VTGRPTAAALLGLAILLSPCAAALDGRVLNREGDPIVKGRVCYVVGTAEQVCSALDEQGRFKLPDSRPDRMRIVAEGYLPRVVSAVMRSGPWVLDRASTLRVHLRDARTGEPVGEGEVDVLYASGRRRGPFPANRAGVRVRTMDPGVVHLTASAAGYRESAPLERTLVAGETLEVFIDLDPLGDPPASGASRETSP